MSDDSISRRAAINALTENKEMINAVLDSLTLDYNTRRNHEQRRGQINEDIETIKALPPAEPKMKGKWIKQIDESINAWWYECSACGDYPLKNAFGYDSLSQFCPWCGAELSEGEENG